MTKQATKERTRGYEKLGYNMWKTQGSNGEWHYITSHLNPLREIIDQDLLELHDRPFLLMCSCRSFMVGIPADRGNPFITPCKHIQGFDETEVSLEEMEHHS